MIEPGSLVDYRSVSGMVPALVVDIVPDVDRTYYALRVTARTHRRYAWGTELLVPVDSTDVVFKRPSQRRTGHTKTHCANDHPFTPETTLYERTPGREGVRHCLICNRAANARYYRKRSTSD